MAEKGKRHRLTKVEMEKRKQYIHGLLDLGFKRHEIAELMVQKYEVSRDHAGRCVDEIKEERTVDLSSTSVMDLNAQTLSQLDYLYRHHMSKQPSDLEGAQKILEIKIKLIQQIAEQERRNRGSSTPQANRQILDDALAKIHLPPE